MSRLTQLGQSVPGGKRTFVVTPGPVPSSASDLDAYPCVPQDICAHLRRVADTNAQQLLPEARRGFCEVGLGALPYSELLGAMELRLTEPQLVHTAYFHDEDVLDILCLHIEGAAELPVAGATIAPQRIAMLEWIAAFKASVHRFVLAEIESEPPVRWETLGHTGGFPHLVARR